MHLLSLSTLCLSQHEAIPWGIFVFTVLSYGNTSLKLLKEKRKFSIQFRELLEDFSAILEAKNIFKEKEQTIMTKILLLEDDPDLCRSIQQELMKNGYSADCCSDGETAMLYALNTDYSYDLAIVDRMLPVIDGLTIIKAMRRKNIQIPIIIITGMSALDDRVDGLDGGADDYLVKPFHIRELMARVRALTRRPRQIQDNMGLLSHADLLLDYPNRNLTCSGQSLILTAKEAELLSVLIKQPGHNDRP